MQPGEDLIKLGMDIHTANPRPNNIYFVILLKKLMKHFILSFFSIVFLLTSCSKETNKNVFTGGIVLTSPEEIAEFGANNYTKVEGSLSIIDADTAIFNRD